jgi:hypothetical protein
MVLRPHAFWATVATNPARDAGSTEVVAWLPSNSLRTTSAS